MSSSFSCCKELHTTPLSKDPHRFKFPHRLGGLVPLRPTHDPSAERMNEGGGGGGIPQNDRHVTLIILRFLTRNGRFTKTGGPVLKMFAYGRQKNIHAPGKTLTGEVRAGGGALLVGFICATGQRPFNPLEMFNSLR